jgi:N-acetylglucosaminyl-diphospho-decaprenol L-rhamnosyltransferase
MTAQAITEPKPLADDGISLIMVTYHAGDVLFKALGLALKEALIEEIILIDNGSQPKVEQEIDDLVALYPHVKLIRGQGNIGFGRAVNLGAKSATLPWLVVLNPDAFLQDGCLMRLREAARGQPAPCIVGARLLNEDGSEQRGSRRGEVTPVTTMVSLLRLERFVRGLDKFELHRHDKPLPSVPIPMPTVSGACFLISAKDFALMDGFDPAYFLHVEDVDLCWRARQMGGVVLFHPSAHVIHIGHSSQVSSAFIERHKGAGLVYFFDKRADTLWRKTYLWFLKPLIRSVSYVRGRLNN